jgi:hypothetical protein
MLPYRINFYERFDEGMRTEPKTYRSFLSTGDHKVGGYARLEFSLKKQQDEKAHTACEMPHLANDMTLPTAVDWAGPGRLQAHWALHPFQLLSFPLPLKGQYNY